MGKMNWRKLIIKTLGDYTDLDYTMRKIIADRVISDAKELKRRERFERSM